MKLRWYIDILKAMYDVATVASIDSLRDKKQSEGLLSLITNVILDNRKAVSLVELECLIDTGIQMANDIFRTPATKESVLAAYQNLFPSQYKPVTESTLVDLFNAKSLKKAISEYDPDELLDRLKGRAFDTYRYLVQQHPDQPVRVANFVQELVKLGVSQ
jgi:acyl carrier protein phosphodiesterase